MEASQIKRKGASSWDSNPCGGDWQAYETLYEWLQTAEPYWFEILGRYEWQSLKTCEVGCGQGVSVNKIASLGSNVLGLDMSIRSLVRTIEGAQVMKQQTRVRVLCADAENLPLPSNTFDRVVCGGVLHHTPDTQKGIDEIYRILKPQGLAIVMLYRTGNPKWWAVNFLRQRYQRNLERLRQQHKLNDSAGTALLELYGVPILKAVSNLEARAMFSRYSEVRISNHQAGFRRLADIAGFLRPFEGALSWFDERVKDRWGFYQVIEAVK